MIKNIKAEEFERLRMSGGKVAFIDVRTPFEFNAEYVEGANNIPLSDIEQNKFSLDRSQQIYVLCRSGKRAMQAAQFLDAQGYNSSVIEGGILAWKSARLPVKAGVSANCLPVERQAQIFIGSAVVICSLLAFYGSTVFFILTGLFGVGLVYTAMTGNCFLARLLLSAPWNQVSSASAKEAPKDNSGACCGKH